MATIATQPLIVAKVGLQSRPPPERKGKPFKTFGEVMQFIIQNEGPLSLFKGIGPQILKGLLVQGLLMMTKERYVLFRCHFHDYMLTVLEWNSYSLSSSRTLRTSEIRSFARSLTQRQRRQRPAFQ
jgi:hypothetical protein